VKPKKAVVLNLVKLTPLLVDSTLIKWNGLMLMAIYVDYCLAIVTGTVTDEVLSLWIIMDLD
jgi:hypothetical protein